MVAEENLFGKEKTFFHGDAEVGDPFDFLARVSRDDKLREPERVNVSFSVFDNIIEDQVEEDKQLNPHGLIHFCPHHEHPDFRVVGVEDVDVVLGVD